MQQKETAKSIQEILNDFRMRFSTGATFSNGDFNPDNESHRREVWIHDTITSTLENQRDEIIRMIEGMNECWCGGGKHFAKNRVAWHTSECALNNEGFYSAINKIITKLKEVV